MDAVRMSAEATGPRDYLAVTYSEERLPAGEYPNQLAAHLAARILGGPGRLLDVGCGRGEYLQGFSRLGYAVAGLDSSRTAGRFSGGCEVKVVDLDCSRFPYPDDSFDFVFSKSVVEHLRHPERLLAESLRVLRPGGRVIIMTPSWRHQQRVFFEDFGHVRPFGLNALRDALTLAGFDQVHVEYFRQLPAVWCFPPLGLFSRATALLPLPYRPWDRAWWPEAINKWIRFSKELMLLGVAAKPR